MESHIVEILVILVNKYPSGAIKPEDFEPLSQDLIERGYTHDEIESALFWYHSRQQAGGGGEKVGLTLKSDSFRILHEVEKAIITPKAYGYLISLRQLGLITLDELDAIIEKAVLLGSGRVELEDIKLFVASEIMEHENLVPGVEHSFYLKTPSDRIQ